MIRDFKKIESSHFMQGIPPTHKDSHLYNFREDAYDKKGTPTFWKSLVRLARVLLEEPEKFPKFVFLCGNPGNGKTHYLVGLYRALVKLLGYSQGDGAAFYTFPALNQEIIAGFKDNIPIRTALQNYTQARFLFLDDFTATERILKPDSMEQTILRDIILDRYDKGFHLITTTNYTSIELLPEMDRMFGAYISSRLHNSKIIQFPSVDLRKVKG